MDSKFKRNKIIACMLITVVLLSSILTGCTNNEETKQKNYLQNYLEKKYGKEFVVDRSRYTGSVERYIFVAHEVKEHIYFEVKMYSIDGKKQMYDSYAFSKCTYDYTELWKLKIDKLFSNPVHLSKSAINFTRDYSEWLMKARIVRPDDYSVDYLIENSDNKISGFYYSVIVFIPDDSENYISVYEDLYKLVEKTKKMKIKNIVLDVDIVSKEAIENEKVGVLYKELSTGGDVTEFIYEAGNNNLLLAARKEVVEVDLINNIEDFIKAYKFNKIK